MSFTPADIARLQQRKLMSPEAAAGSRYVAPAKGPATRCPAGHPADALGSCLGTCGPDDDYHDHHPNA